MNKVNKAVLVQLQDLNCDPVEGLAQIATAKKVIEIEEKKKGKGTGKWIKVEVFVNHSDVRTKALSELLKYCKPQLKAIEHEFGIKATAVMKRIIGVKEEEV